MSLQDVDYFGGSHRPADPIEAAEIAKFLHELTAEETKPLDKPLPTPIVSSGSRKSDSQIAKALAFTRPPPQPIVNEELTGADDQATQSSRWFHYLLWLLRADHT